MVHGIDPERDQEQEPFLPNNADDTIKASKNPTTVIAIPVEEGSMSTCVKSFVLLILFFGVNIAISVFNKWEFNGPLRCPIYVTMTHQIICFICCLSLSPWIKIRKVEGWNSRGKLMLIPLFFIGNIALNNVSLLYTTLALNQLIRAFCPVVVALMAWIFEDKRPSWGSSASIACLVLGVTLSVAASPDLEVLGTIICFASVLGNALQTVTVSVLKVVKLDPLSIIYHTSLFNCLFMTPLFFALGEHTQLVQHVEEQGIGVVFGLTIAGGGIAFAYDVILLSFIQNTSSVYSSVAGSFKTVLILWISFMFFHQRINLASFVGIIIACVAFVANSVVMVHEKRVGKSESVGQKQIKGEKTVDDESFPTKTI
uniref:Sugar phosphate transporter domain-containing protein n=1 Tax=Lotharella oceanica TaxID=641309 RepID=A0A7S2TYM8_9EUKA|mmetsp:Transcript_34074/g.63180  ORF Transcript_34074/g.63180 Transcript_34074/m.63180 type:complete len:370 (+) Transcript_34074:67-1176(+)|eukprot:CAMPEP_0170178222 /NCGR_PEP_ID=MMETSP0040_2-20121228/11747_1 /TAXON_ID=641309 /ORGANISM="Lotharella oceanica, Strain CCMP622" /LENGTH=369 /DNA_ID=CAMNT_0010421225 /DNA_START=58 /DNA_END=1167 /DNA_ORIENTATION=+